MANLKITPYEIFQRKDKLGLENSIILLNDLIEKNKEIGIRKESIKYLGIIGNKYNSVQKEIFKILENILISDNKTDIKCEAAECLGKIKYEKALSPLKWILEQNYIDNQVKISALRAIANIRFEDSEIKLFINKLDNNSQSIKDCIKNYLIKVIPEKLIKALLESLKDESRSEEHKIEVIKLLGLEISSINVSFDDYSYLKVKYPEILSDLINYKNTLLKNITSFLREEDLQLNESVLTILKILGENISNELIIFLENDDFIVKKNAIKLIGKLNLKSAVSSLIKILDDIYYEVSIASIKALGNIGDLSAVPELLKILNIENVNYEYIDLDLKWYIFDAITKIYLKNKEASLDLLLSNLKSDNDLLKESIAYILGEIARKEFIKPLTELLKEKNLDVKKNAIIALGKIGNPEAIDPLISVLNDNFNYWLLKKVAIDAIYNIYYKNQNVLNADNSNLKSNFFQNIQKLINYLNNNPNECFKVKLSLIKFLENFGDKTAIQALLRLINDFHNLVKISASKAIKKIEKKFVTDN